MPAIAKLFLIPSVLSDDNTSVIPTPVSEALRTCTALYAENIRTTRRFIKKVAADVVIDNIEWFEIGKNEEQLINEFTTVAKRHNCIGLVSEAGCPAVADPGYALVAQAHALENIAVVPLVGPSSIMLALMASGLGGQRFAFHGYLPLEAAHRKAAIQKLWQRACDDNATQLFMETPYRNNALFTELIRVLPAETKLAIAANLTAFNEITAMKTVASWRKTILPDLHKQPCIFALGQ